MLQKLQKMLSNGLENISKSLAPMLGTRRLEQAGTQSTDEAFKKVCYYEKVLEDINNQISELELDQQEISRALDRAHIEYTNLKLKD